MATPEEEAARKAAEEQREKNLSQTENQQTVMAKLAENTLDMFATAYTGALLLYSKKTKEYVGEAYEAGIVQSGGYSQEEMFSLSTIMKEIKANGIGFKTIMNTIFDGSKQIINQLKVESELRRAINEETGLTGELAENLREEIWKAYPGILNMGYGIEEVTKYYTQLVEKTGKFTLLNSQALTRSAEISRAFVGDLSQMADVLSNFEKVGLGASQAMETVNDVGVESLSLGLRSKTTIKDIGENIEKVNQYGFAEGIKGLAEMSRKAAEFRTTMENTFTIAEKVISPEGAIDMAANLQVIGGAIGDFADPLKMMYMATNNVEGLQDALIGAAGSLATYNSEQGKFEVSGANLRRGRDMANAMGISLGELTKTAIAAGERSKAAMDLLSTGLQMDDKDREFLMNLGTMKDGKMTIQVPESLTKKLALPTEIAVGDLTEDIKRSLLDNKNAFKQMDARDIAQGQLTELTKMERNIGTMAAMARVQASKMIKDTEPFKKAEDILKETNQDLLNAWSGGKFEEFVRGGLGKDTDQGKAIIAGFKDVYGDGLNLFKDGIDLLREKIGVESKKENTTQTQNVQGNVHFTISSANNQEALVKAALRDPQIYGLTEGKRSFTYVWDE